jgi:peroxiredoxin Q/BCP
MAAKKTKKAPKRTRAAVRPKASSPAARARGAKKVRASRGAGDAGRVGEGSRAPRFAAPDSQGTRISSSELSKKPYILYFYPKDDTSGCTREACGFRDQYAKFTSSGLAVIGVSPDSEQSHQKFQKKYGLPFTLLSDADRQMAQAWGVWVKKKLYGREYMGIERSTFLVDGSGVIRKAWRGVRVDGHVEAVLDAAKSLGRG